MWLQIKFFQIKFFFPNQVFFQAFYSQIDYMQIKKGTNQKQMQKSYHEKRIPN